MQNRMYCWVIRLVAAGALSACAEGPTGMVGKSPDVPTGDLQAATTAAQATDVASLDDEYERLVDSIPGFGGFFVADDGSPTVNLVDETRAALAAAHLAGRLDALRRSGIGGGQQLNGELRIQKAAYDFRQLRQWRRVAEAMLDAEPSAVYLDVDERSNRVEVALEATDAATRVAEALARHGVPPGAVRVVTAGRSALTSDSLSLTAFARSPEA